MRATTLRELRDRGISPASVVDQVAAGAARAVATPTPTVRVPILDAISSLFDTPKMTAKVRARVDDALDAINVLHGVRSDVTWNAARTRKVGRREIRESVEPRGSIPIELRAASSRGEGGHFASFHDVDEIMPLRIVLRPSTSGPMMNYETVLAHELGHYIDYNLMPRIAKGTSSNAVIGHRIAVGSLDDFGRRLIDDDRLAEAMGDVFRAVYDTETWAAILRIESRAYRDYFTDPKEVFARVYAQWVSERAGTPAMRDELRRAQAWPRGEGRAAGLDVFTPEEFERIGAAMDELFRTAGMLR